jgi:hypothetical protein
MFGSRCSPISYGIVCDLIYDADKHLGEPVRRDPRDNRLYAVDQIEWIVLQVHTPSTPSSRHGSGSNHDTYRASQSPTPE